MTDLRASTASSPKGWGWHRGGANGVVLRSWNKSPVRAQTIGCFASGFADGDRT